jgi:hypothetical protein
MIVLKGSGWSKALKTSRLISGLMTYLQRSGLRGTKFKRARIAETLDLRPETLDSPE